LEVYERLIKLDDRNAPDLVIGADTVIVFPPQKDGSSSNLGDISHVLEKPDGKADQLRMLQDMNGKSCEVVTGVTIAYPTLIAPGFKLQSISISTIVTFNDNPPEVLQAYVDNGEGIDRAGGFAIQGVGSLLIKSIEGDYNNVVGFPTAPFWRWIGELIEDGTFDD